MAAIDKRATGIGGIKLPPINLQQFRIRDDIRIIADLHRLQMTGSAGADLLVGGIFFHTAGVPGNHFLHTVHLLKTRFHTPETARGKSGLFQTGRVFLSRKGKSG